MMKSLCETDTRPTIRSGSHLTSDRRRGATWSTLPDSSTGGTSYYSIKVPSSWTVGKVSLIFLLLAAVGDLALIQFRGLDHFEEYDALSTDVIRPAFTYKSAAAIGSGSSSISSSSRPNKASLGSAAIGSVTEALSPILPFTGGVDLRREDYWSSSSPWETLQSLSAQLVDAFAPSTKAGSIDGSDDESSTKATTRTVKRAKVDRTMTLSASEPFVKTSVIAQLTLADVTETFRYAVESSKPTFDDAKFMRRLVPDVKRVIAALKDAVERSRGEDAQDSQLVVESTSSPTTWGGVDALKFSAAMRIFAEWRLLRQTPDGYKGYAVGMSLGHKDIVQNVVKIEQAVHAWLDDQANEILMKEGGDGDGDDVVLRSPTIAQLLQREQEMNVHPSLPRLKDKTAAMGLLWVRRQLQYQTSIFSNAVQVPKKFATTKDAVAAAYSEVYDRYHGWAVQKIFNYSFQSAPDAVEIYRHMNPRKLQEVKANLRSGKMSLRAVPTSESVDTNSRSNLVAEDENPFVAFFQNIGNTWDDVAKKNEKEHPVVAVFLNVGDLFKQITNQDGHKSSSLATSSSNSEKEIFEMMVSAEMVKDASEHIHLHMEVVEPLLDDLAGVFATFNMDDPTRV